MGERLSRRELLGMRWVWSFGGLSIAELTRRVAHEVDRDDVLGRAAQLSFYFFLSVFPLLIFATSVLGYVLGSDPAMYAKLLEYLRAVMPPSAFEIVATSLNDVTSRAGAGNISLGLLLALWSGSAGMDAVITGLNAAYSVREFRSWWKRRLLAVALTVVVLVLLVAALLIVLMGGWIGTRLPGWIGQSQSLAWTWMIIQGIIVLVFMLIVFTVIYLLAPNVKNQRWQAILPGSVVAFVCWIAGSLGFKLYLTFFDSYSKTYGALGAIVVLMLWLYLSGVAILLGGEVNSEIRNAAAAAGAPEAQRTREDPG
jgi:membrane protein